MTKRKNFWLDLFFGVLLFAAGATFSVVAGFHPKQISGPVPTPVVVGTPLGLVNQGGGRPMLEQVRKAWGIQGPLDCAAGPTPGAGSP